MKEFSPAIANRFKESKVIAVELIASSAENRRWIGIYHFSGYSVQRNIPPHLYSIYDFEVSKNKVDENFGPADIVNNKRYYVNSEDELFSKLIELNIAPSSLTYPWKCDYPL